jgi:3-oxoacyl-[acyl-carrier protein] reductase
MQLTNKRALITGGTKGIGAAVAIDLAQHGCDIAINGRYNDSSAEEVRDKIISLDRKCHIIVADVARPDEVQQIV